MKQAHGGDINTARWL